MGHTCLAFEGAFGNFAGILACVRAEEFGAITGFVTRFLCIALPAASLRRPSSVSMCHERAYLCLG